MATEIYSLHKMRLLDDTEIEVIPLKIKYLRGVMEKFSNVSDAKSDSEVIDILAECAEIAMKQFRPDCENAGDLLSLSMVYELLDYGAGIRMNRKDEEEVVEQAKSEEEKLSWKNIDLAKLESEAFLLGIWKSYDELESSISMPELMITLSTRRELDYDEKKFLAAMQGVDIDAGKAEEKGQVEWERLKARVFSRGQTSDPNDIMSFQGQKAKTAGFGVGLGLDYENLTN